MPAAPAPAPVAAPAPAPAAPALTDFTIPHASSLGSGDPIHAPLDTADVVLPTEESWVPAPDQGAVVGESLIDSPDDVSWVGLRPVQESSTFEPGVESVAADQWADEVPTEVRRLDEPSVQQAESLAAQGNLGAALGMYQDLAALSPDDPRLWQRIEELAKALQRQSSPPE